MWERLDGPERIAAAKMGVDADLLAGRSAGWIGAGQSRHVSTAPYHQVRVRVRVRARARVRPTPNPKP